MPVGAHPYQRASKRKDIIHRMRQWTSLQIWSHMFTMYPIISFGAVIQPDWLNGDGALSLPLVALFWLVFTLSLVLYALVYYTDQTYREGTVSPSWTGQYEARRCEDCTADITRLRVKHCQSCGKCIEDFDHHCRYMNVCVGGRTYAAWFWFVAGLFTLMASSFYAALQALRDPEGYVLASASRFAFYLIVGLQATISILNAIFLFTLLAQHLQLVKDGVTTLEQVKAQAKGFPALPPRGWRKAVRNGECYLCNDELETMEVDDENEVWFCTVCQSDIGKAGIEFLTCDSCDNVNVCPLCRTAALDPTGAPVVTYRVASLRRRAEAQAQGGPPKAFRAGSYVSRLSSFASQREPRLGRRTLSTMIAAVEGHTGEPSPRRRGSWSCCGESARGAADEDTAEDSESSTDDTPEGF